MDGGWPAGEITRCFETTGTAGVGASVPIGLSARQGFDQETVVCGVFLEGDFQKEKSRASRDEGSPAREQGDTGRRSAGESRYTTDRESATESANA